MEKCKVEGCDKSLEIKKYGLCNVHYQRYKRYGRYERIKPIGRQICNEDSCSNIVHANNLCRHHYDKMYNDLIRNNQEVNVKIQVVIEFDTKKSAEYMKKELEEKYPLLDGKIKINWIKS